ncbi:MAG: hypothetical protein HKN82_02140 [Akkermansiaceae bacterium]|nr:hypothetical protein [Akkermansiaceae bacterium]NNM29837.1 hypothetical protein [Akkermansiaceae bacterium]
MTTTTATRPPARPCGTLDQPEIEVFLEPEGGGAVLAREPVRASDLALLASHANLEFCMRRSRPDRTLADLDVRLVLVPSERSERFTGLSLRAFDPDRHGEPMECNFSILAFEAVARRAEKRLLESGRLRNGELFLFGIAPPSGEAPPPPPPEEAAAIEVIAHHPAIHYLSTPVAPLIKRARRHGEDLAEAFPVFFTEEALARAEQCARQGTVENPRFESGALLAGSLGTCPESGEFFLVVTDAFAMTGAESSLVTLELTGETWRRIDAVIRARQTAEPATALVGNAHGHNFLPNEGQTCEECPRLPECSTTNLQPSPDDLMWMRTHFPHAPYAQCLIFGLSARGDNVHGLFGFHDGRLVKRHYFVLPDFTPGGHPTISVPQSR